jgi:hypothetical protein
VLRARARSAATLRAGTKSRKFKKPRANGAYDGVKRTRHRTTKAPAPRIRASLVQPLLTNHMLGHAAAEGQPLSEHRTTLSPVPSTCVAVVVGVLHVGMGGITVATTVLLFPTNPVT